MDVKKVMLNQRLFVFLTVAIVTILGFIPLSASAAGDKDGDGVPDNQDNCLEIANPGQRDTDSDNYGNICDGDLNNDNKTNTLDLNLYKLAHRTSLGDADYNPHADFNDDGSINTLDLNIYKKLHRKPPGPSGTIPSEKYRYDSLGRLTEVIYGNGKLIIYDYDLVGNRKEKRL